jgi:hypothetical protein
MKNPEYLKEGKFENDLFPKFQIKFLMDNNIV